MCNVREGPTTFGNTVQTVFLKKLIFFAKNYFFYVLDCFDVLISKIIFLKKIIILMHFETKRCLKNNHNHTPKQLIVQEFVCAVSVVVSSGVSVC